MVLRIERRSSTTHESRGIRTMTVDQETLATFERKMRLDRLSEGTIQKYLGDVARVSFSSREELEDLLLNVSNSVNNNILSAYRKLAYYGLFDKDILKGFKKADVGTTVKSAEELLTREQLQKLLDACQNSRDRAFLAILFESQCRPSELQMAHISQVIKVPGKYKIIIPRTKTHIPKTVFIYEFQALFRQFLKDRGKWQGIIFAYTNDNLSYKCLNTTTINNRKYHELKEKLHSVWSKRFIKIKKRAGFTKEDKMPLKLFRPSGSMDKKKQGVTIETIQKHGGWKKDSQAFRKNYFWLSDKDMENEMDEIHLESGRTQKKRKSLTICPNCSEKNSSQTESCVRCGETLTFDYAADNEDIKQLIMNSSEIQKAVIQLINDFQKKKEETKE